VLSLGPPRCIATRIAPLAATAHPQPEWGKKERGERESREEDERKEERREERKGKIKSEKDGIGGTHYKQLALWSM
jgi:ribosomal protein L12E/L44/L45/RPP1/RPP2